MRIGTQPQIICVFEIPNSIVFADAVIAITEPLVGPADKPSVPPKIN